jgi:hypothetical protein
MELRFTPVALSVAQGFALEEVMDWVIEHSQQAGQEYGVITRLLISFNRHESHRLAEQVFQLLPPPVRRVGTIYWQRQVPALPCRHGGPTKPLASPSTRGPASNIADAITTLNAERSVRRRWRSEAVAGASAVSSFEVCISTTSRCNRCVEHPPAAQRRRLLNVTTPRRSSITDNTVMTRVAQKTGVSLARQRLYNAAARAASPSPTAPPPPLIRVFENLNTLISDMNPETPASG